jgi:hypothetical protein
MDRRFTVEGSPGKRKVRVVKRDGGIRNVARRDEVEIPIGVRGAPPWGPPSSVPRKRVNSLAPSAANSTVTVDVTRRSRVKEITMHARRKHEHRTTL